MIKAQAYCLSLLYIESILEYPIKDDNFSLKFSIFWSILQSSRNV
nr:MAG TPA: hypothetical protein [Bacteriophage sp.]